MTNEHQGYSQDLHTRCVTYHFWSLV